MGDGKEQVPRDGAFAAAASKQVLFLALDTFLRLIHPCMPFVTEELWQFMPGRQELMKSGGCKDSIMLEDFPRTRRASSFSPRTSPPELPRSSASTLSSPAQQPSIRSRERTSSHVRRHPRPLPCL